MGTTVIDGGEAQPRLAELLNAVREAIRGGRLREAEQTCESIIHDDPAQPDSWFLMGSAALREGCLEDARKHLSRAVEMRRGFAPYRIAYGQSLRAAGDTESAHRQFHDACVIDPLSHEAAFGLAGTCAALGRKADAAFLQRQGFRLLRRNALRHMRHRMLRRAAGIVAFVRTATRGAEGRDHVAAMQLGRWLLARDEKHWAYAAFEAASRSDPDDADAQVAMARIAFDTENFPLALEHAEAARALAPAAIETRCEHGRVLSRMAHHDEALEILEELHLEHPDAIRPLLLLGWARFRAGQTQRAIANFDAVLERAPASVEAHFGRARALADAGNLGEAMRWLHRTVALSPGHAGALRDLANLKEIAPGDREFARIEEQLSNDRIPTRHRQVLHMAAAAACHGVKAHGEAFEHYRTGNLLKDVVFDIDSYARHIDSLIATFDTAHFARTEGWGARSDLPVFIVGMPRSGTSLVEQILASHPRVHGAGEREEMLQLADRLPEALNDSRFYPGCIDALTRETTAALSREFLKTLRRADPQAGRITDKMPGNFHHVGLIATLFPNAPIIHCRRDPRDTCLSIYFGDFIGSHPYSYDLTNLGRYHRECERLMAHWHTVLPRRILDIRYEELVDNQEEWSRRLVRHCGLDWNARCLDFHKTAHNVRTLSNAQVRQPIYRTSIERWRAYEDQLGPLLIALED
jgi:tetratricopeptide (TPR) repeat protein